MPFELKTSSGIVSLEWNTWAMHRFSIFSSNKKDADGEIIPIPIGSLMKIYTSENLTFHNVINMIRAASDAAGNVIDEKEASRLIDEGGGLNIGNSQILEFIQYTIKQMLPKISEEKVQEEEKKS